MSIYARSLSLAVYVYISVCLYIVSVTHALCVNGAIALNGVCASCDVVVGEEKLVPEVVVYIDRRSDLRVFFFLFDSKQKTTRTRSRRSKKQFFSYRTAANNATKSTEINTPR